MRSGRMIRRPVRGFGGGKVPGPPAFTPASIASLSWWLDDRAQTDDGSGLLSAWDDQSSGALNDMTQGTSGLRMSLGRSINTYSAPEGPGGLARYIDTTRNITQVLSATAFTVYFVVQADAITRLSSTDGTGGNAIWGQNASGYYGLAAQIDGAGTGYRMVWTAFDTGFKNVRSADGSVSLATPTLVVVRLGGGFISVRVGAAALVSTAFGAGIGAAGQTQGQRLGCNYVATAATGIDGLIGTVVGFNALLANGGADDLNVRTYLAAKYGCAV